jgi:hypothetical protein
VKLLTVGNTKTMKGEAKGYRTFILHLAPANLSGYNVCPAASKGCRSACLNTAGRGRFTKIQDARIRKTRMFFEDRDTFMKLLAKDIIAAIRNAERNNLIPVFRLNGTSDIRWENIPLGGFRNIMEAFPHYQFYDYTKLTNRVNLPANYHLTFSRSESPTNQANVIVLKGKVNIAVVFNTKKGQPLPSKYIGLPVVDGDETDLRFLDPHGVIVGLRGKGDAKKDSSNFVVTV